MLRGWVLLGAVHGAAAAHRPSAAYGSKHLDRRALADGTGRASAAPWAAAAAPAGRRLDACGDLETYIIGAEDDTVDGAHAGSIKNPIAITAGCPLSIEMAPGKAAYTYVDGFAEQKDGAFPLLKYAWKVDSKKRENPLSFFSFRKTPSYYEADSGTFFDWYYWPLLENDVQVFYPDAEKVDYYHCYGYCGYEYEGLDAACEECGDEDLRASSDRLLITLSSYPLTETTTVTLTVDVIFSGSQILDAEFSVVADLFMETCERWSHAPEGWSWNEYRRVYSPELGERDTRLKPYCDWWPKMTSEKLATLRQPGAAPTCESIPGVVCDEAGHVTNIIVNAAGLRGPLPSLEALTHLEVLELPNNRLTGNVPPLFSASTVLRELELSNNDLTGSLPCPAVGSELRLVAMSHNRLSGALPACYFTRAPQLQILSMSKNDLDATFPAEIVQATRLAVLYLDGAGLRGELALIGELRSMGKLDLSHNFLTGELPPGFFDKLPALYQLDLSWNLLRGQIPVIPRRSAMLRRVDLSHNAFGGELSEQFEFFAQNQDPGVLSELHVNANDFCGELPFLFYNLLMDSHFYVTTFDVSQNHFRCAAANENEYFDTWAQNQNHDFGMCTPVADPRNARPAEDSGVYPGSHLVVEGTFVPTTQAKCKFSFAAADAPLIVDAFFVSTLEVSCRVPASAPLGPAQLTVAHYCSDFASEMTLPQFRPVLLQVEQRPESEGGGSSKTSEVVPREVIIGLAVAVFVAGLAIAFIFLVVRRERQGEPLFSPVGMIENPLFFGGPAHDDVRTGSAARPAPAYTPPGTGTPRVTPDDTYDEPRPSYTPTQVVPSPRGPVVSRFEMAKVDSKRRSFGDEAT